MTSYPAFEDGTDVSETSAFKNQKPGLHPKDYSQYSKHGESLKSRIFNMFLYGDNSYLIPVTETKMITAVDGISRRLL
jgi:hypothetical protein